MFRDIHLMYKGANELGEEDEEDPSGVDKYQCPDTGAHFEFIDMLGRLKKLQQKRTVIDKVIESEKAKAQQQEQLLK